MSELERTPQDVFRTIESGEFYQDYDQSVADLGILRERLMHTPLPPAAVTVKPLVWDKGIVDWARPLPGMKYVACSSSSIRGGWSWWLEEEKPTKPNWAKTESEAKAAAQADYERRILSALTPAPVVGNTDAMTIGQYDDELRKVQGGWRGMGPVLGYINVYRDEDGDFELGSTDLDDTPSDPVFAGDFMEYVGKGAVAIVPGTETFDPFTLRPSPPAPGAQSDPVAEAARGNLNKADLRQALRIVHHVLENSTDEKTVNAASLALSGPNATHEQDDEAGRNIRAALRSLAQEGE